MSIIRRDLVERHVQMLSSIPVEWEVAARPGYKLDLRMCQIQNLHYDFQWEDGNFPPPEKATIIHTPQKVLVFDVSLNEVTEVGAEHLAMMPQLRVLDLSLNRITRFGGIESCTWLYHINLSHNMISGGLEVLASCRLLTELDLSMNQLSDLSNMPPLSNLSVLRLNNNQLHSLNGIQGLAGLKDLSCQRNNIHDILPLSSSMRLISLNASDNQIQSLDTTVDVLKNLPRLHNVLLFGNPIDKEYNYHEYIMKATSIQGLDNVNIRPRPRKQESSQHFTIKDAAQRAFVEKLQDRKLRMQENVQFLQRRIDQLQEEYREYEEGVHRDMEACVMYLDGLGPSQLEQYDVTRLRNRLESPAPRPWEQAPFIRLPDQPTEQQSPRQNAHVKGDYRGITSPPEVLRHAYNELASQFPNGKSPDHQSPNTPTW